ncbi:MAG TPA: GNAT family N-acetyltransferase [Solirubrobacteraceae bacterium]
MIPPSHATDVRTAGPDRLHALAPMFGRAFVDEPMLRWSLGLEGDLVEMLGCCFGYVLERVLGLGMVREAGGALGAAFWIPPEQPADWEQEHPWSQARITALARDGGRRYDEFWEWVESCAPDEPMWLLDSLAVQPSAQGQGLGRALIDDGLLRARADGIGVWLSTGTGRNVAIYERCGFRVAQAVDPPGGGPQIWFMRWDP